MTYKEIQGEYKRLYQKTVKNCWIADVKNEMGFPMKMANNRKSPDQRKYPCTDIRIRERIKTIIQKGSK